MKKGQGSVIALSFLQCYGIVGWATGRASWPVNISANYISISSLPEQKEKENRGELAYPSLHWKCSLKEESEISLITLASPKDMKHSG